LKLLFFRKKFAINIYQNRVENYPSPILRAMMKYAYKHVDIIFSTLKNFSNSKSVNIPDFIFDKNKYNIIIKKKMNDEYFLCIGSIVPAEKDYEQLINAFKKHAGQKLVIAGPFLDVKAKIYLENLASGNGNIELRLKYIYYDEYLNLIKNAKAVILPYKKERYENRSSGVLLETIYLNTPVIAPNYILDFNGVAGYGYDSPEMLEHIINNVKIKPLDNSNLLEQNNVDYINKKIVIEIERIFN
jgi:glycosyltransferase involved in cell wall biosynthesis